MAPCKFDHNGECLICDCWPDNCAWNRLFNGDFKYEKLEELITMFKDNLTENQVSELRNKHKENIARTLNNTVLQEWMCTSETPWTPETALKHEGTHFCVCSESKLVKVWIDQDYHGKFVCPHCNGADNWPIEEEEYKQFISENKMPDVINFYSLKGEFGCFSNFSRHSISLKGETWPTTEHYFQAQKFVGTPHEKEVQNAPSPGEAADMGRDRKRPLRADWESVKIGIMRDAVRAKFTQNKSLKETLLSTGSSILVEHTKNDNYWGDGGDGSGKNMLGKILMEVREELRKE